MKRCFRTDWVFGCAADQLAEPGDHVPVIVGGQPVILVRTEEGELSAVSNVCAHRGTLLVDEPGNAKRFQCPYHAWTYASSGRLLSVPHAPKGAIDRDAHRLPVYRAEQWAGLVFVCLDSERPSLAGRLGPVSAEFPSTLGDPLHHWPSFSKEEEWAANWKLIVTNAMESYHLFKVHPETLEPYTPTATAEYGVGGAECTVTSGELRPAEGAEATGRYTLISLPPSFVAIVDETSVLFESVEPVAPDRTIVRTGGVFTSPAPGGGRLGKLMGGAAAKAYDRLVPDFLPEDKAICERGQRAASGDFEPGRLVPMERVVADFHSYLGSRLLG